MKAIISKLEKKNLTEYLLSFEKVNLFTKTEMIERAYFSNNQINNNQIISQKKLELQSKKW